MKLLACHGVLTAALAIACGNDRAARPPEPSASPPPPPSAPIAIDAVPLPDARLELVFRCDAKMSVKGWTRVRIDPVTMTGAITRVTAGAALTRNIHVVAERAGPELTLRFDRYDPLDHTTIRGQAQPRPPNEKLVSGKSVVARLVTTAPGVARMYVDGEVDWTTDSFLVVTDHYSTCTEVPADRP